MLKRRKKETTKQRKMDYKTLNVHEKYKENPFVEEAIDNIRIKKRTQMVGASSRKALHYVVNSDTNEVDAYSAFLKVVEVDEERFAKLFLAELGAFWDLSKPAIRVFTYISTVLKPHSDRFIFTFEDCMEYTGYKSKKSIITGLSELIEHGIIARTTRHFEYFINPMIVFNGSRVTFAKTYIKKQTRRNKQVENKNQMKLFEGNKTENLIENTDYKVIEDED